MALADLWGRLALIGGKTPHNRLSRLCYCKKDSGVGLKEVEAGGNGVQNPSSRVEIMICSSNTSGGYRVLLINESMHLDI